MGVTAARDPKLIMMNLVLIDDVCASVPLQHCGCSRLRAPTMRVGPGPDLPRTHQAAQCRMVGAGGSANGSREARLSCFTLGEVYLLRVGVLLLPTDKYVPDQWRVRVDTLAQTLPLLRTNARREFTNS